MTHLDFINKKTSPKNIKEFIDWHISRVINEKERNLFLLGFLHENIDDYENAYKWFYIASLLDKDTDNQDVSKNI